MPWEWNESGIFSTHSRVLPSTRNNDVDSTLTSEH